MNVNLHLTGELEAFINELVHRGLAANKTEAIRLAIIRYYEDLMLKKKAIQEPLNQSSIEAAWNNTNDERASGFYLKRYAHAGKA